MALSFDNPAFSNAIVILGAAGIVIPAFARFRITPIIGFILVGLLIGPFGLGSLADKNDWLRYVTIEDTEAIEPFAEFGIILLLFSIGLELSFKRLWSMRRLVFGVGAAELLVCGVIIGLVLHLMGQSWTGALGLGLALALSSTALVLPIAGTKTPVGRAALAMLLFEDIAIVPIIFLFGALAPNNADGAGWDALVQTLWLGSATIIAMMVLGRLLLPRVFAQAARTKSPELFMAVSLLVIILASLATGAVGLSPIVGALLAGLLIAETEYHEEVEVLTAPFKGLALGVFLITVGMNIDIRTIIANWPSLITAVTGVVLIKAVVTGVLLRFSGARIGTAAETGVLMASPSETTLIVLAAATQAQLIQQQTAAFWQIVTAIGLTITPLLARIGHDVARRMEMRNADVTSVPEPVQPSGRAVIIGFGRVGEMIGNLLKEHGQDFVAVENDIEIVARGRRHGFPVVFGDVVRPELQNKLALENARVLILTMNDPVFSATIIRRVRKTLPDLPIIARAKDPEHAGELYRAGATNAIPETLESSLQMSESALVEMGVAMGPVIASIHEKRDDIRKIIRESGELDFDPRLKSFALASKSPE